MNSKILYRPIFDEEKISVILLRLSIFHRLIFGVLFMGSQHQNMFQRGTSPWSIKRFKEVTLTRWLADVAALEENGLEKKDCDKVADSLRVVSSLLSAINVDSIFYKSLWEEFEELVKIYDEWNNGWNAPIPRQIRRDSHRRMLVHRKKMWKKAWGRFDRHVENAPAAVRDQQLDLITEVEKKIADDIYVTFRRLSENYPNHFPLLHREMIEFGSGVSA